VTADCQYMHALVYGLHPKSVHERKVCTVYSYLSGQRCVFSKVCTRKVWDLDVVGKNIFERDTLPMMKRGGNQI